MTSPPAVNVGGVQEVELGPWQVTQGSRFRWWRFRLNAKRPFQNSNKNKELVKHDKGGEDVVLFTPVVNVLAPGRPSTYQRCTDVT